MKKLFSILVCIFLVMSFAACKDSGDNTETTGDKDTTVTTTVADISYADTTDTDATNNQQDVNIIGAVPESEAVSASYFDNTAFVGDSVSLKLSYYAAATGALGKAQFFTAGSLGAGNALWEVSDESVHPSYQGVKMLVEDCIANSGADTVYIMLGMNDIGLYGIDDTIENYKTLLGNIKAKAPNVSIVVQSMTPMTDTSTIIGEDLNNENIKVYNNRLLTLCQENGWAFVDVASVMYDEQGVNLNRDFCSDPDGLGVHFTEAGCEKWVEYLSTHTP